MKCIETKNGKITKVDDQQAQAMVSAGDAKFVPKSKWKEKVRGPVKQKKEDKTSEK